MPTQELDIDEARTTTVPVIVQSTDESPTVSTALLDFLRVQSVHHVFGIPGGYVVPFVAAAHNADGIKFVLSAHEGGAAYMAQGYSQVTRRFGVVVTTAGPAALNAVTGLAQAASDNDAVLLVHGTIPEAKKRLGALQDTLSFQCDIAEVIRGLTVCQKNVGNADDFLESFAEVARCLVGDVDQPRRGPVHLHIGTDVLGARINLKQQPWWCSETSAPDLSIAGPTTMPGSLDQDAHMVARLLERTKRPVVFAGNGISQANAEKELMALVDLLQVPLITTAKGVAAADHDSPLFLGQHSIFPHVRPVKWLEDEPVDLVLALGTSLGEYGTNSFSEALKRPELVHVDRNPHVFGRGMAKGVESRRRTYCRQDIRAFLVALTEVIRKDRRRFAHLDQSERLKTFRHLHPCNLDRVEETLRDDTKLTGQRVVFELSEALAHRPRVNIVADTGTSKLYASHYIHFRRDWRLFQPGGFDTMGYAVAASVGVTLGARDMEGPDAPPTVCIVGDGSVSMNNELSCLASNIESSLLIFILNDYRLSTVYQGFAAVSEQLLVDELSFRRPVNLERVAQAQGLRCVVVEKPGMITKKFIDELIDRNEPVVIDCRIDPTVLGPGVERFNAVRAMNGRPRLTAEQMSEILAGTSRLAGARE